MGRLDSGNKGGASRGGSQGGSHGGSRGGSQVRGRGRATASAIQKHLLYEEEHLKVWEIMLDFSYPVPLKEY